MRTKRTPNDEEWDRLKLSAWEVWKTHGLGDGSAHWIALDDALQRAFDVWQSIVAGENAEIERLRAEVDKAYQRMDKAITASLELAANKAELLAALRSAEESIVAFIAMDGDSDAGLILKQVRDTLAKVSK